MNKLLILLCQSIHAFQKERGSLCLFLSTKDDFSLNKLLHAFQKSDSLIEEILAYKKSSRIHFNPEQEKSYKKLANIFSGFLIKADFREKIKSLDDVDLDDVNKLNVEILDVTPLYTHSILIHLTYIFTELALFDSDNIPSEISAISNFINWKERIGRERALGIVGFALNEFDSQQFSHDFNILLSEQKINERSFAALASSRQKKIFEIRFKPNNKIDTVHIQMETNDIPNINAQSWFKLVTEKMEMMHEIELQLIKVLEKNSAQAQSTYKTLMEDDEKKLILDFPFFRNLSDETIHELFKLSNIKKYKKGSLLFLEGEPASRIYVIVSGWVKIYKSNANGNETVEQMLSSGNLVIETSLFTNEKYYSSAQISNEAKLLSFPASIFRGLLNKDLAMALNSLKYLSQTSRSYLSQIDNNRLKSSTERVGWFLLKQFIEQKNPNTILLPYEKTIIASLLDMKPETFSRSLKSFKKRGLSSEKHQIQIKDIKELCHYCDAELSKNCQFKEKYDCKFK